MRCRIFLVSLVLLSVLGAAGCATSTPEKKHTPQERANLFVDAAYGSLLNGEPMVALEHLRKAEELAPDMPELHHTRALVLVARQDIPGAMASVKKALELKPDYSAANTTMGKLLMDQGNYKAAVIYLDKAASDPLYREVVKPLTSLGVLYYRTMNYEKSKKNLDLAIASEPKGACVAYYYRGHIHLHRGEFNAAVQDYQQATRRYCADFAEAHLALGIAYERNKQFQDARKVYLEIRDRFSQTAVADQAKGHLNSLPY